MKRLVVIIMVGILAIVGVTGCSAQTASIGSKSVSEKKDDTKNPEEFGTEAEGTEKKETVKIAGMVFMEDQFMKMLEAGYKAAAQEDGAIELLTSNTGGDIAKEASVLDSYVQQGVQGIAIAPCDVTGSISALKRTSEQGTKICLTNMFLSTTKEDISFVEGAFASMEVNLGESTGLAAAEFINENLDGNAKIAVINYDALNPVGSADRTNGFLETVKSNIDGEMELVATQSAWEQDTAIQVVNDILTASPDVNIVWAANDGGTVGATMAVASSSNKGKTFVFGTDCSEQILQFLESDDNVLQAVTGQDSYSMGYHAVKHLAALIRGEETAGSGEDTTISGMLVSRSDAASIDNFKEIMKKVN